MLTITARSGLTTSASFAISLGLLVPTSQTRYPSPGDAPSTVSGTPMSLLKLLIDAVPRIPAPSTASIRRTVVVFPFEPTTAITLVLSSVLRYAAARRKSARRVVSCTRITPIPAGNAPAAFTSSMIASGLPFAAAAAIMRCPSNCSPASATKT